MKKICISGLVAFGLIANNINAQASNKLNEIAQDITYNSDKQIDFIRLKTDNPIYESNAERFLSSTILEQGISLKKQRSESDDIGFTHNRYQLYFNNALINEAAIITHSRNGKLVSINGSLNPIVKPLNSVSINSDKALQLALKKINAKKYSWENTAQEQYLKGAYNDPNFTFYPKAELVIYTKENKAYYAYKLPIYAETPLYGANVFVDAQTGKILAEENLICTIDVPSTANTKYSGVQSFTTDMVSAGNYRLRETGRGNGIETYDINNTTTYSQTDFTYTNTVWPSTAPIQVGEDAHWGTEMTYDYYKTAHNRNSIDNLGFKLISYVHYGVNYANAFWNGFFMTYGDGGGSVLPLTTLDITGHEITHGLTGKTAGLGGGEAGALNEGFSDIFGTTIEAFARPSNWNWVMGTDNNFVIRNLQNPKSLGQPDTYMGINWDPGGEVHQNDGPIIYWYYLLTAGGSGTNDKANTYSVTGLGMTSAAKIAFRALTVYFVPSTNYASARNYAIAAASDLYGPCSNEVFQTTNAFYAIGVGAASTGTLPPVANFASSSTALCALPVSVNFINTTIGGTTYKWDFGDGSATTTAVNPLHTYTANGTYNVKLKSTYICSSISDSITKSAYIIVSSPAPPTATGGTVCGTGSANLSSTGTGLQYWYSSPSIFSTLLNVGNNFITPSISANTTYYVANTFTSAPVFGGPASVAIGTSGSFPGNAAYDIFDVLQPCSLKTVVIKANTAGNRTIELRNSSNTVITNTVVNLPVGTSTVNIDFYIVPGTGYRLGLSSSSPAQLFRNTTGATYPYNIGGLINITGCSSAGPYFYFFYNWEVVADNCSSYPVPVTATVLPGPALSVSSASICSGQTASLTASGASTYSWNTGSNSSVITVTPTTNTTYTISASNGGCVATTTTEVTVNTLPMVSLTAANNNVCASDSLVVLSGMPMGGVYSGTGVSGVNFNPSAAGTGTYTVLYNYTDANNCSNTNTTSIIVAACVGIKEYTNSNGFSIYPNPANDFFVVRSQSKLGALTLKVMDAAGKLVIDKTINNSTEQVDISKLAKGIYFIEVKESSETIYRAKIVKQ